MFATFLFSSVKRVLPIPEIKHEKKKMILLFIACAKNIDPCQRARTALRLICVTTLYYL